eukprot:3799968-Rhodomonas_salina.3
MREFHGKKSFSSVGGWDSVDQRAKKHVRGREEEEQERGRVGARKRGSTEGDDRERGEAQEKERGRPSSLLIACAELSELHPTLTTWRPLLSRSCRARVNNPLFCHVNNPLFCHFLATKRAGKCIVRREGGRGGGGRLHLSIGQDEHVKVHYLSLFEKVGNLLAIPSTLFDERLNPLNLGAPDAFSASGIA